MRLSRSFQAQETMSPPKYADLGKAAKDLLTKDYGVGETKVCQL